MRYFLSFLITVSFLYASANDFDTEFSEPKSTQPFDPLSGYNEIMTSFNDGFYEYLLRPTAQGYAYIVPQAGRECVSNVFNNLLFPIRFVNNVLQFKFQNSVVELGRFTLNSTLGFAGLIDVARNDYGLVPHDEDFGQTLGHYGVGSGFHVVLPFIGPSNVRDIVGLVGDYWISPLAYVEERNYNLIKNDQSDLGISVVKTVNSASFYMKDIDSFRQDAIELYPFLRNLYETRRTKQISE